MPAAGCEPERRGARSGCPSLGRKEAEKAWGAGLLGNGDVLPVSCRVSSLSRLALVRLSGSWTEWAGSTSSTRTPRPAGRPRRSDPAAWTPRMWRPTSRPMAQELEPRDDNPVGTAIRYSIGMDPVALYGVLRHEAPAITTGWGVPSGLGLFLPQGEGPNARTGLSARPGDRGERGWPVSCGLVSSRPDVRLAGVADLSPWRASAIPAQEP